MATQPINRPIIREYAMPHSGSDGFLGQYSRFAVMIGLSFLAMYVLMFSMISSISNFYHNINMFYIAGLMAAPMAIIEILLMSRMYPSTKTNVIILISSVALLVLSWFGIRSQLAVGDNEFVRSMIPHHSGAILMCNQANIQDAELKTLCADIVKSQQDEIDQMKSILARLNSH